MRAGRHVSRYPDNHSRSACTSTGLELSWCRCRGTSRTSHPFSSASAKQGEISMLTISNIQPLVALIAGILILLIPRLLNFIVAIYLIAIGIMGLVR
jgi:hypothetical protein